MTEDDDKQSGRGPEIPRAWREEFDGLRPIKPIGYQKRKPAPEPPVTEPGEPDEHSGQGTAARAGLLLDLQILILAATLSGCTAMFQRNASIQRQAQINCADEAAKPDPSWWRLTGCGPAVLPPECLITDAAARGPHCVAFMKAAFANAVITAAAQGVATGMTAAVTTELLVKPAALSFR